MQISSENTAVEIENGLKKLILDNKGKIVGISHTHTEEVFKQYFTGGPPFDTKKSRKDIPDAFIFSSIKEAAMNQNILVHAITSDNALYNACYNQANIFPHKTINDFLRSDEMDHRIKLLNNTSGFDAWKTKFEKILSENVVAFWDEFDRKVASWMRKNLVVDFEGTPLKPDHFATPDQHKLLENKTSVLSPLTAILGVVLKTSYITLRSDKENADVFKTVLKTIYGSSNLTDVLSRNGVPTGPATLDVDITVQLVPDANHKRESFNIEVNNVSVREIQQLHRIRLNID